MFRIALSVLAFFALLVSSPARADWQFSKWGMTPEQVVAASGGKAAPSDGETKGGLSRLLAMPYVSGELEFDASFWFDDTKALRQVLLRTERVSTFYKVQDALMQKYGEPFSKDESFGETYVWHSDSDEVTLVRVLAWMAIMYRPLANANNSGL